MPIFRSDFSIHENCGPMESRLAFFKLKWGHINSQTVLHPTNKYGEHREKYNGNKGYLTEPGLTKLSQNKPAPCMQNRITKK